MDNRLTFTDESGKAAAENVSAALKKLKALEDMTERLTLRQQEISGLLDELKVQGKKSSYQFKELAGEKLINANVLTMLKINKLL